MVIKKQKNNQRGITLIALIVTIFVLITLAGITLNAAFSDKGILKSAEEFSNMVEETQNNKGQELNSLLDELKDAMNTTDVNIDNSITTSIAWSNEKATLTLGTTIQGATIYYKLGDASFSQYTAPIPNLSHGATINVKLVMQDNTEKNAVVNVIDAALPYATITPSSYSAIIEETITVTIANIDNESGVNTSGCKYIFNQVAREIGISSSAWSTATAFNNNTQTINLTTNQEGTYYLHVLTVDKAGNKKETISEAIKVNTAGESIVADLVNQPAASTNTYTVDKYGNKIVIPAGFTVVANGTQGVVYDWDKNGEGTSTGEPVVQDGIVIRHETDLNEFVWVPVGEIKNDAVENTENITNIQLGRYQSFTMTTTTTPPTPPSPKQEASKTAYDTTNEADLIASGSYYFFENSTGTYNETTYKSPELTQSYNQGANFETLGSWIENTIENGGYYIARYEASYGTDGKANSKPSEGTPLNSSNTEETPPSTEGQLWNYVSQPDASTASKVMYQESENLGYYSELVNSYAWDTAIIFIQAYEDVDYASKQSLYKVTSSPYQPANTGERGEGVAIGENTTDKVCNIYDMASNVVELTTETSPYSTTPCVLRGGGLLFTYKSSLRTRTSAGVSSYYQGFRPLLNCNAES